MVSQRINVWSRSVNPAMTYFCFIESSILSVPHMEPLDADDLPHARAEAELLLHRHASGYAAHVFLAEERVVSLTRADLDRVRVVRGPARRGH